VQWAICQSSSLGRLCGSRLNRLDRLDGLDCLSRLSRLIHLVALVGCSSPVQREPPWQCAAGVSAQGKQGMLALIWEE
tara:strand:- start:5403 stop:5636 length:234 start_codon:yes stop_codon:yes gene_type:complete